MTESVVCDGLHGAIPSSPGHDGGDGSSVVPQLTNHWRRFANLMEIVKRFTNIHWPVPVTVDGFVHLFTFLFLNYLCMVLFGIAGYRCFGNAQSGRTSVDFFNLGLVTSIGFLAVLVTTYFIHSPLPSWSSLISGGHVRLRVQVLFVVAFPAGTLVCMSLIRRRHHLRSP